LPSLNGEEWKDVRTTFSPIFTSGKMKAMMVFIRETCKHLTDEIRNQSSSGNEFELKNVFGKFSMDTLASCAFGVDAQSFSSSGICLLLSADRFFEIS
jgi:cytochrome P450